MNPIANLVSAFLAAAAILVVGCAQEQSVREQKPNGEIVAIHVTAAGVITMNGREVSIDQVKQECARLASVGGSVLYSRDNPTADPHPNAMEVLKTVADANLPILMPEQ